MRKKPLTTLLLMLFVFVANMSSTSGSITVGVKAGEWIEYSVSTTGVPPEVHNVQWARMDIVSVQGAEIKVNVTTQDNNGKFSSQTMDLNLEEGRIGAWFIIPANLNVGDQFYDINLARNVTIEGQAQNTYAGALRTVINASTPERIKDWDKATGVFLKSIDTLPGYAINATATKTNIWNPKAKEANYAFVYGAVIVVVIAVAAVVVFAVLRRRTT